MNMLVSDFIEYLTSIGILAKDSLGKFQSKNDDLIIKYISTKEIISIIPATTVEDIIEFLCLLMYSSLSFSYISIIFKLLEK